METIGIVNNLKNFFHTFLHIFHFWGTVCKLDEVSKYIHLLSIFTDSNFLPTFFLLEMMSKKLI